MEWQENEWLIQMESEMQTGCWTKTLVIFWIIRYSIWLMMMISNSIAHHGAKLNRVSRKIQNCWELYLVLMMTAWVLHPLHSVHQRSHPIWNSGHSLLKDDPIHASKSGKGCALARKRAWEWARSLGWNISSRLEGKSDWSSANWVNANWCSDWMRRGKILYFIISVESVEKVGTNEWTAVRHAPKRGNVSLFSFPFLGRDQETFRLLWCPSRDSKEKKKLQTHEWYPPSQTEGDKGDGVSEIELETLENKNPWYSRTAGKKYNELQTLYTEMSFAVWSF